MITVIIYEEMHRIECISMLIFGGGDFIVGAKVDFLMFGEV